LYLSPKYTSIACPYEFHRRYLAEQKAEVEEIFGTPVEVCLSVDNYKKKWLGDPVVLTAVESLGGEIVI
jgi:hypothetical protein